MMTKSPKSNALIAFCCVTLFGAGSAAALELQVAIPRQMQNKPTTNSLASAGRSSLLVDFNLALAREICRRINATCTYAYPPFSEIIPGIEEKRFQLGFGSYLRTPEREARVAFSDSIWRSSSRLLARPEIAARFAARLTPQVASPGGEISLETLRTARVTVIGNSQQHRYLQSVAAAQGLTVQSMATMGDCLDALYKEDADFAFLPVLNAYVLLDPSAEKKLAFVGPGMVDNGLGGTVHIALPREDRALRKTVDEALAEMRRDGSYPRIWRQHFPFDFY